MTMYSIFFKMRLDIFYICSFTIQIYDYFRRVVLNTSRDVLIGCTSYTPCTLKIFLQSYEYTGYTQIKSYTKEKIFGHSEDASKVNLFVSVIKCYPYLFNYL